MFKNFIKELEENWEQIGGKFDENLKNLFKSDKKLDIIQLLYKN